MSAPSQKMERKPPIEFTPARKVAYLENLRKTGLVYLSAEMIGTTSWTIDDHRKKDKEFDKLCAEAKQNWVDSLVAVATKRAVKGTKKPIIGGKNRDEIVAYERNYSDGLLSTLLRASRQEFRDGQEAAGGAGASGPVMFIPSAVPQTMDDWEKQHGEAAKGQGGK